MRSLACVTRVAPGGHRLSSELIQTLHVAVIPNAMNLDSLVGANCVTRPVGCFAVAFTLVEGEKTSVLRALLGEDIEPLTVAGNPHA